MQSIGTAFKHLHWPNDGRAELWNWRWPWRCNAKEVEFKCLVDYQEVTYLSLVRELEGIEQD